MLLTLLAFWYLPNRRVTSCLGAFWTQIGPKSGWRSFQKLMVYRHETTTADHPFFMQRRSEHRWPGHTKNRSRSHHRNTIAAAPSYCDISLMITLSPGHRPLLISIRFTEVAPNCTGTFFAEWPSGSSLKSITRVFVSPPLLQLVQQVPYLGQILA